jgi:cell division FtsZ-interacting protein ZapD
MLHDYVSGTNYNIINPNVALDEIEDVVDALEAVDLREAKGEAKFELEKAMETYQKVLSHINNVSDVSQKNVTEFRDRLDDLKQCISQAYKDQAQVGVPPPRLVINLLLDQFSNSHTHFRRIVW